jgi:regulator of sigma E protease
LDTNDSIQPRPNMTPAPADPAGENLPDASWFARNGPYLMLFGLLLFYLVYYRGWELDDFSSLTKTILGLGMVIFLHELGHFAVAKWCNVKVLTFSLGFGPALPGCAFRWGETLYKIALFPVGGYVNMLGEGTEGDDADVDPRSFKNKSVLQRMAIISAGVIMNVILALVCFVFVYMTRGAERTPAFIDRVDPGSPLWQTYGKSSDGTSSGIHRGDIIRQIGNRKAEEPFPFVWFDNDLQPTVMLSSSGEPLMFVFSPPTAPEGQWIITSIEPRLNSEQGDEKPVIGLTPTQELKLPAKREAKSKHPPVFYQSAAYRADNGGFQFGDEIVGTSTLDKPNEVTELPLDPTDIHKKKHDYFEFQRRMKAQAGKPVIIRVRRALEGEIDEENAKTATVDLNVPPAYRHVLGMRMTMGAIAAVRPPAKDKGVQPDDTIEAVEITDNGKRIRFAAVKINKPGVEERDLDPDLLPLQLDKWAREQKKDDPRLVTLSLARKNPPPPAGGPEEFQKIDIVVPWDDAWAFNAEVPLNLSSPLSLSCLGIAYRVKTTVKAVEPGSAADAAVVEIPGTIEYNDADRISIKMQAGDVVKRDGKDLELKEDELVPLKAGDEVTRAIEKTSGWWIFAKSAYEPVSFTLGKGAAVHLKKGDTINLRADDVITEVLQYYVDFDKKTGEPTTKRRKGIELKDHQWGYIPHALQDSDTHKIAFKVKRGGNLVVSMDAKENQDWPLDSRGLLFLIDSRLKKAKDFGDAVMMGVNTTTGFIRQIYASLNSLVRGRVSPNQFVGPVGIGTLAFSLAGVNMYQFILFLGIISVNLAVVNFLPIPVLDGGHMCFLIWEGVRGRPASEGVRAALTYAGLLFIFSLMIFVVFLDVKRLI